MTLQQLLSELNLTVNFPDELGNLTVDNETEFCRYALLKYFKTENFQKDLNNCLIDLQLVNIPCSSCSLVLRRHRDSQFSTYLKVNYDEDDFNGLYLD